MKVTEQDKEQLHNPHKMPGELLYHAHQGRHGCLNGLTDESLEWLKNNPGKMERFATAWSARQEHSAPSVEEILAAIQELAKADTLTKED